MNSLFTGLSPKDITYISDIMKTLVIMSKKAEHYESSVVDQQVRTHIMETRMMANTQFEQLLGVLQNG